MIPPQSEIAGILQKVGKHYICPMEKIEKIAELVIRAYQNSKSCWVSPSPLEGMSNNSHLREFSRENQVKRLDSLLQTIKTD
jgi:hypothetical protein